MLGCPSVRAKRRAGADTSTLTATLTGSGTTNFKSGPLAYQNYTFNITGFSNVGADPNNAYTIFSFSNSSIENSPDVAGIVPFSLPDGWSFSDSSDFVISTDARGIHAFDPTFGLTIFGRSAHPPLTLTAHRLSCFIKSTALTRS